MSRERDARIAELETTIRSDNHAISALMGANDVLHRKVAVLEDGLRRSAVFGAEMKTEAESAGVEFSRQRVENTALLRQVAELEQKLDTSERLATMRKIAYEMQDNESARLGRELAAANRALEEKQTIGLDELRKELRDAMTSTDTSKRRRLAIQLRCIIDAGIKGGGDYTLVPSRMLFEAGLLLTEEK